jgi:peptidoglycan/LPS O-acetylase OafA/YrhL
MMNLLPHLAASVGYLHNLIYAVPSDINFVAWSLEIEVQFYLCAPLFAFLIYSIRRDGLRRLVLVTACIASGAIALLPGPRVSLSLAGQLPYFLAGILLADIFVRQRIPARPREAGSAVWDLVFLLTGPVVLAALKRNDTLIYSGPLAICLAYYAAFRSVWIRTFLRAPFVSTVGGMCYSIYLLHNYVIAVTGMVTERWSTSLPFTARLAVQTVLIGPAVLAACGAFYLLIERPCMRPDWPARLRTWGARMIAGSQPAPVAAAAD